MADLDAIEKTVQLKVGNSETAYLPAIDTAIVGAWAVIADAAEWPFLGCPNPVSITWSASVRQYRIGSDSDKDRIGRPLFIANSAGAPILQYARRKQFRDYLTGRLQTEQGMPSLFTIVSFSEGRPVIEIDRIPTTPSEPQAYFHYQEAGTVANLDKLPAQGVFALMHGVMSILAPPKEARIRDSYSRWDAVTYKEDELFEKHLADFIRRYASNPEYQPGLQFDPYTAGVLQELGDYL